MRLPDTSVLVNWGTPSEQELVVPYLQRHVNERFTTSSLVVFEFFRPAKRLLIASHARECEATLVTYDTGDFESRAVQQLLEVDVITQ